MNKLLLPLLPLLLTLLLWTPLSQCAQPSAPLSLQEDTTKLSAAGHMRWLRDPDGQLSVQDAYATSNWRALPGTLNLVYTSDAIWLRLEINRTSDAPEQWILRFTNALLDDVRLYRPDSSNPDGWREQRSGENTSRANWTTDTRYVALPLTMTTVGKEVWLVRINTKNAMSTDLELWERGAFEDFSRREYLYYGMYFGCYFLLILFHCLLWRLSRETYSLWYLAYIVINTGAELLTLAFPQQVFAMSPSFSDTLLGLTICFSVPVGVRFSLLQLDIVQLFPRWSKALTALGASVFLIGATYILSGDYGTGVTIAQQSAMLLIVGFILLALWMLWRGHQPARFYLLAFSIFFAGVIVSFLRNMAVVPYNFWTANAAAVGTLIHMLLMSLRLAWRYDELKTSKELAQQQAAEAERRVNESLELQVTERTLALQEEIAQRIQLEQFLRQALETERRIKEEQQDFVAMVSHEFRTPLAIINTTAQQLSRNLDAPHAKNLTRCKNLRDAAQRMTALVDEYLTADRMDAAASSFRPAACDMQLLLQEILTEWPSELIATSLAPLPTVFTCDHGLLKVAVRNLIANAKRHSASGKPIEVAATMREDGQVQISVSNHGDAIPEDEIPSLFQKYFRGRFAQHKPGAGLGLYLVQRIVDIHGGSIELRNEADSGMVTFTLCIPDLKTISTADRAA